MGGFTDMIYSSGTSGTVGSFVNAGAIISSSIFSKAVIDVRLRRVLVRATVLLAGA